jgi:hypothetical protein
LSAKARRARVQQRVIPVIGFLGWACGKPTERAVRTTRAMNSRRFMSEHWDFLPDAGGGALLAYCSGQDETWPCPVWTGH